MKKNHQNSSAIFETYKIRRIYDEQEEIWYFSVIDIIAVLIEQKDFNRAKSYWTTLKNRMNTPRGKPRGIFDKFVFDTRRKRRGIRP